MNAPVATRRFDYSSLSKFVDSLQAEGRYSFLKDESLAKMQVSAEALKKAVARLVAKKRVAMPKRGFYVIVPIEYRSADAPPPSWFIDELMHHLGRQYYVGLLSASALYGAAHQQPQEFQVVTGRPERPISVGRGRIRFVVKKNIAQALTTEVKTETGTMRVATPETTALDLVRYVSAAAGLGNVATVLAELAERINPQRLVKAARINGELAHAQRLGYLLCRVGAKKQSRALADWLMTMHPRPVLLRANGSVQGHPTDPRWRVIVNEGIEVDL
jgi:predicted transcriptional regulator of viral defense system